MDKFLEESAGVLGKVSGKRLWRSRLISTGVSSAGKYYSPELLEATGAIAFPVGTHIHADHQSWRDWDEHPENSVKTIIGVIASEAQLDTVDGVEGLYANVEFTEAWAPFVEQVGPYVGLSVHAQYLPDETEQRNDGVEVVSAFMPSPLNTVDLVTAPGANGKLLEAIESYRGTMGSNDTIGTDNRMDPKDIEAVAEAVKVAVESLFTEKASKAKEAEEAATGEADLAEALIESELPKVARESVYRRVGAGETVEEAIKAEKAYFDSVRESFADKTDGVFHGSEPAVETFDFKLMGR